MVNIIDTHFRIIPVFRLQNAVPIKVVCTGVRSVVALPAQSLVAEPMLTDKKTMLWQHHPAP